MTLDINELYILLQKNEWDKILNLEKEHRSDISENKIILNFFNNYFIPQTIQYSKEVEVLLRPIILKKVYFRFLHIRNTTYSIEEKNFTELVENYLESLISAGKEREALVIAKDWNHLQLAKSFISKYEKENLKEINHIQSENLELKKNIPNNTKYSSNLFKSNQEIDFFYALRDVYQQHFIYPNVALSCIIDYKKIKDILTVDEKKYFFMAIVDCVVFKHEENNYHPELCFELDSIYHDKERQIENDKLKNQILSKSGHKLYRIRGKDNQTPSRNEFKKLIRDAL